MVSVECYVLELDAQRDKLANILNTFGIEASTEEKYNSLVEKVMQIEVGGVGVAYPATPAPYSFVQGIAEVATILD